MKKLKIFAIIFALILSFTACQDKASAFDEQYDLGIKYLTDGNYEEAIIAFEAAIEIDSKNPNAYIKLADVYIEMGDEERAIEVIEDGLIMLPDNKKLIRKRETIISVSLSGEVTTGIWDNIIKGEETEPEVSEAPKPTKDFITIKGEQYSTSLTELDLSCKGLTDEDIIELSEMTNLTVLYLYDNNISNIYPLAKLTNLTWLYLDSNNISDIFPLAGLKNLTDLNLSINNISDISPLSELTNLTHIELNENNISDISPLAELSNLNCLSLAVNNISDISPLSKLTNLVSLNLYDNNISNIVPLTKLTNLVELVLSINDISDISPLSELANLSGLNLEENNISDITPLAKITNLNFLSLAVNNISDISPLSKLPNLLEVDLSNNPISEANITALKKALPDCSILF